MDLLELLNTKHEVIWKVVDGYKNEGSFELDNNKYVIQLDEYSALDKTLVDFGFTTNGKIQAIEGANNSAKIIGSVMNGASDKIKEINPDAILVSVAKNSGLVESRKSLYDTIFKWLIKKSGFTHATDWLENEKLFTKIISQKDLSDEEINIFRDQVKLK